MENDFLCLSCKKLPESVYECIYCGGPYCYKCISKKIKCLECKNGEFQISNFGNMALNMIEVSCPQCHLQIPKISLDQHMSTDCENIKLKCLFKDCQKMFSKKEIIIHLINNHEISILEYFEGEKKSLQELGVESMTLNKEVNNIPVGTDFKWFNSSKSYLHGENKMFTFTSLNSHSGHWSARVLIKKCDNPGYVVIGIFNRYFKENKGYLGGDMGHGSWGLAGNGALGEHGKWKSDKTYKEGDIVEIIYDKGIVSYTINGIPNSYKFKFGIDAPVYLAATCYYKNTNYIILDQ